MRTLRVALGVSLALHAAFAVLLASLGAPVASETPPVPTSVVLVVPPAPATLPARASPSPSPPPSRPQAAPTAGAAAPAPATPSRAVASAPGTARLPLPEDRLVGELPRPATAPRPASAPVDDARPLPGGGSAEGVRRLPAAAPTKAPEALPPPSALLGELERAATPAASDAGPPQGAAAVEGRVEAEASFGPRTPRAQPVPDFPEVLRREGREADVSVRVWINAQGAVDHTKVEQSSGDTAVDNAVERVVRGYLFDRTDGDTIDEGVVTFHFRLKKGF